MGRHRKSDKNEMVGTTFPPLFKSDLVSFVDKFYDRNLSKYIREATIEKFEKDKNMKSLIKDDSAVAYLLLVLVGFYLVIVGITYNFLTDFVILVLSVASTGYSHDSRFTMDTDGVYGLNVLISLLIYSLIPLLVMRVYYTWNKAQKPESPY
jgi:hypothetical protein